MPNWGMLSMLAVTLGYLSYIPIEDMQIYSYNSSVTLNAIDTYTSEYIYEDVRVFKEGVDLGELELNNNVLATVKANYTFYFFMNITNPSYNYYPIKYEYESVGLKENITVKGCPISQELHFAVLYNGRFVTKDDPLVMGTYEVKEVLVRIEVPDNHCYGMPDLSLNNSMCFVYNGEVYGVKGTSSVSHPVYGHCASFKQLHDGMVIELPVTIKSFGTDPHHIIDVYTDDVSMDLRYMKFEELYGFEDEYNENYAAEPMKVGEIYIG